VVTSIAKGIADSEKLQAGNPVFERCKISASEYDDLVRRVLLMESSFLLRAIKPRVF
jgi:hypothetical protein